MACAEAASDASIPGSSSVSISSLRSVEDGKIPTTRWSAPAREAWHADDEDRTDRVAPEPSARSRTLEDLEDFDSVFAVGGGEHLEGGQQDQTQEIKIGCGGVRPCRLLTEGGALLLAVLLASLVSFVFVALFYGLALSLPSPRGEGPASGGSWVACGRSGGQTLGVTELGRQFPLHEARALTSLPKFFGNAAIMSLCVWLIAGGQTWVVCLHGLAQFGISVACVPLFLLSSGPGAPAMPTLVDPLVTLCGMLLMTGVMAIWLIRPRPSAGTLTSKCPKLLFSVTLAGLFALTVVLMNVLTALVKLRTQPGLIVAVCIVLVKTAGFVWRCVLKGLRIPFWVCFAWMLVIDAAALTVLRRYFLSLPSLSDVASSALASAVAELACNLVAATHAIFAYNASVRQGHMEKTSVQINLFCSAVVSQLISEHVALHSSLAYNLFLDPRVLSVDVTDSRERVTSAWALSFGIEVLADAATVVPMILLMPTSQRQLLGKCARSFPAAMLLLLACIQPHLSGAHAHLDADRYLCK